MAIRLRATKILSEKKLQKSCKVVVNKEKELKVVHQLFDFMAPIFIRENSRSVYQKLLFDAEKEAEIREVAIKR